MSNGFKGYTAADLYSRDGIFPGDVTAIASVLGIQKNLYSEDDRTQIKGFVAKAKDAGMTAKQAIAAAQSVQSQQEQSSPRQQYGATAGTPQEAIATIQKSVAPVLEHIVGQRNALVSQCEMAVDALVEDTINEIAGIPALYVQRLQARLQVKKPLDDYSTACMKDLDLVGNMGDLFALPPASTGRQQATKLLKGA
jgi:hypothetical protein